MSEIFSYQFIYHKDFEYGLILKKEKGSLYSIYFPKDNEIKKLSSLDINSNNNKVKIEESTIKELVDLGLFNTIFPYETKSKSKEYLEKIDEDNLIIEDKVAKAKFLGTYVYDTYVKINSDRIILSCNCSYNTICKHLYALISRIKDSKIKTKKEDINSLIVEKNVDFSSINDMLSAFASKNDQFLTYSTIKKFIKDNATKPDNLNYLINLVINNEHKFKFDIPNFQIIEILVSFRSETTFTYLNKKYKSTNKDEENSLNNDILSSKNFLKYLINDEFDLFNKSLSSLKSYLSNFDLNLFSIILISESENINFFNKYIFEFLANYLISAKERKVFLNFIKNKEIRDSFIILTEHNYVLDDDLKNLNPINILNTLKINNEICSRFSSEFIRYHFLTLKENKEYVLAFYFLFKITRYLPNYKQIDEVSNLKQLFEYLDLMDSLPDPSLIKLINEYFLTGKIIGVNEKDNFTIHSVQDLSKAIQYFIKNKIYYEGALTYFNTPYVTTDKLNQTYISGFSINLDKNIPLTHAFLFVSFSFKEFTYISELVKSVTNLKTKNLKNTFLIFTILYSLRKDDFINDLEYFNNLILNKKEIDAIKEFTLEYKNRIGVFNLNKANSKKAKIFLYIDVPKVNPINKETISLELRIGLSSDKVYKIQNLVEFSQSFGERKVKKYGKDFTFIHALNNFDEKSKNFLLGLFARSVEKVTNSSLIFNKSSFQFNSNKLKGMIQYFRDDVIFLNFEGEDKEEKYILRLNPLNIKIEIDENYLLKPKINHNTQQFLLNSSLIVNKEEKVIDIASDSLLINELIELINISSYPSIKFNISDFKYDCLLNSPDTFLINEKIKDELEFDELKINSYFDLVDGKITLDTKLYLNDSLITPNKITNNNLLQYEKYLKILADLGFKNDELIEEEKIYFFLNNELTSLKTVSNIYLSESILKKEIVDFKAPNLKINYENNLLTVFLTDNKYSDEELFLITSALRKKKKYIIFNNEIINLSTDTAEEFKRAIVDYSLIDDENKLIKKSNNLPLYRALRHHSNTLVRDEKEFIDNVINEIKDFKNKGNDYPLPTLNPGIELRNYQIEAYYYLSILYKYNLGGILADDMGLGKTLETITLISSINTNKPILIVCPASLIFNWVSEFNKFNSLLEAIPIYGSQSYRENIISSIDNEKKIYITSYSSLRSDSSLYKDISFDLVVLDEAQFIKNSDTKKSVTTKLINANHHLALTGTPIENSVLDLWSIFDFLMPGFFPEINIFKEKYENDSDYKWRIKRRISPFILRRKKENVLKDLPPKYEVILTYPLSAQEKALYEVEKNKAKEIILSKEKNASFRVLKYLTALREICIDPSIYYENYEGISSKMDYLEDILTKELGKNNKVIIFSQFVKALDVISARLEKKNISYALITGKTKSEERLQISKDFNLRNNYEVLLISLKAGGTGLNLIGANVVIHLDPWWNYAAEAQASDRAHRIGQIRHVKVIKLIGEDTIEQRVIELQNKKKDLIKDLISEDESSLTNLSKEDISFILD